MVGFDAKNKETINSLYLCRSCGLILREPFQLSCGHRQCKTCIEAIEGDVVKCAECSEESPKSEIMPDRGFRNDMQVLEISCSLCDWKSSFKEYEEHLIKTHPNPVCEFCQEKFNSTIRLDEHKQKECTKITVSCPLKEYGCAESVLRVQLADHYLTDQHQTAIVNVVKRSGFKIANEQHERMSTMDVDMRHGASSSMMTTHQQIRRSELSNHYRSEQHQHSIANDRQQTKLSVEEQTASVEGANENLDILIQNLPSPEGNINGMQYVSYDGTLIWKITSFNEKMMDAQSERQTSIYSPPFYSSPTGYKMRARLYLHGDGNARRTHMSLFFVLMRGPNDAILKFPFNYKVIFCLYDQTPQQRHIIDSFRPDIKSNSFQRPRSEMNIASGIPKFVSLG
ncbi:unnamed protein product, partial [Adineta steineri]